mgnify:CR=1 FL=1
MQVSRIRALRGPNLWTRHTAIEAVVSCSEQECSLEHLPGFEEQLSRLFPTADVLAHAEGDALGQLGIVRQRQGAIQALARAMDDGTLDLSPHADVPTTVQALQALPGRLG